MVVKKVSNRNDSGAEEPVPVTVEPLPGHTDEEVVERLNQQAALRVSVLAPRFISAQLAPSKFAALDDIAVVQRKALKQTR